ncbi:MAG TPA: hypothetical protein DCL43_01905, partial [Chitinophagaceae bacterium]|nr:hypothetical protein [Chitinophagaceae bacterium]
TDVTYYFAGVGGSWWARNVYSTTGTGCPTGNPHPRFRNMGTNGTFDSNTLITPVVHQGIQEFHFSRARASRSYSIWVTSDTAALSTNWTFVTNLGSYINPLCTDTTVVVASPTAKRLKIVMRAGIDADIDSIWLTSYSAITLPVKFGNIHAIESNNAIKLSWNVLSEVNTAYYNIEKLTNDNFKTVGTIKATNASKYSFIDVNPVSNQNVYRIKAVDKDGQVSYSSTTILQRNSIIKPSLSVFPNPVVNGNLNFQINNLPKGIYRANVFDATGKVIYTKVILYEGGVLSQSVQLINLTTSGNYYLQITDGQITLNESLMVHKGI